MTYPAPNNIPVIFVNNRCHFNEKIGHISTTDCFKFQPVLEINKTASLNFVSRGRNDGYASQSDYVL